MMDSNLMTAKSLEENPTIQARARTTKTMSDLDPAGLTRLRKPVGAAAVLAIFDTVVYQVGLV